MDTLIDRLYCFIVAVSVAIFLIIGGGAATYLIADDWTFGMIASPAIYSFGASYLHLWKEQHA